MALPRSQPTYAPQSQPNMAAGRLFAIPVNDPESSYQYPEQVRMELTQEDDASYERAAEFLNFNGNDLVCLQHEYGIFGGVAGSSHPGAASQIEDAAGDDASHGSARAGPESACGARRDRPAFGSFDRDERTCGSSSARCV